MEELLRAEHLRKAFTAANGDNFLAVDDVTFSISEGEKVAIIGESGSGKTTVANMVTRLLDVTSGSVILKGKTLPAPRAENCGRLIRTCRWSFKAR